MALPLSASEVSGRLSLLGVATEAGSSAHQQGLRWMVDHTGATSEWSAHLRAVRQQPSGAAVAGNHSSSLFRASALRGDLSSSESSVTLYAEIDRLFYRHDLEHFTVTLGRQALEWGAGHFWQPTNLFGAFSPTDLDTSYKPGIDLAMVEWYPTPLSSATVVHAFAPAGESRSSAIQYRRAFGEESELALVAGEIAGHSMLGGYVESSWGAFGLRLEGRYAQLQSGETRNHWVAGVQHQLKGGAVLDLEWYYNSGGAEREDALLAQSQDTLVVNGLQPQLSRNLLAFGVSRTVTPLLQGHYTVLVGALEDTTGEEHYSALNRVGLNYSLSDESELLLSLLFAQGKGAVGSTPQSEFGHNPGSLTLRYQSYF